MSQGHEAHAVVPLEEAVDGGARDLPPLNAIGVMYRMAAQGWTPAIGLRNATLSLLWRTAVTVLIWCGALWAFHAVLGSLGVTHVPMLIAFGFAALCGTIAGFVLSRGLDERAGFVSPLLTLLVAVFAATAIIGGEALFAHFLPVATDHLRFIIVGATLVIAGAWIVKYTLVEN